MVSALLRTGSRLAPIAVGVALALSTGARAMQAPQTPASTPAAAGETTSEHGFPIESELVRARCGGCHTPDAQKRLSRISYRRASPENWELTVKRMVSLNKVALEPADARAIVKYLADHQGLAPEETKPVAFEAERRVIDFTYDADKDTSDTCSSCHSIGRVLSERRTKDEWGLLLAMHRGYYPIVDMQPMNGGQGFRRTRAAQTEPGPDGRPPDNRHPMDKVIAHLAKALPLSTPEWSTWSAAMQPARLAGRWGLSGSALGKGRIAGEVVITADPNNPDTFTTETRYTFVRGGQSVTRTGKAVVYTGYQWRGRSTGSAPAMLQPSGGGGNGVSAAAPPAADLWREVLIVDRSQKTMTGRWFTGSYDETGLDVTLVRIASDPVVFGTNVASLKTGSSARPVTISGANFPRTIAPADISLGQGLTVSKITSSTADTIAIEVDVASTAPLGPRDVRVGGAVQPSAFVVFDKLDGIKVLPRAGMARVGGANFPKQFQQFEAVGVNNGPDGKPNTKDDWELGMIDVAWSLEEYTATFGDDDLKYVGTLDAAGLFTPNVDGPNDQRSGRRNNIGDVWVIADLAPNAALGTTKPLRARAHLLVTVPLYMNWAQSEVGR